MREGDGRERGVESPTNHGLMAVGAKWKAQPITVRVPEDTSGLTSVRGIAIGS